MWFTDIYNNEVKDEKKRGFIWYIYGIQVSHYKPYRKYFLSTVLKIPLSRMKLLKLNIVLHKAPYTTVAMNLNVKKQLHAPLLYCPSIYYTFSVSH